MSTRPAKRQKSDEPRALNETEFPAALVESIRLTKHIHSCKEEFTDEEKRLRFVRNCLAMTLLHMGTDGFHNIPDPVEGLAKPWSVYLNETDSKPKRTATEQGERWAHIMSEGRGRGLSDEQVARALWDDEHTKTETVGILQIKQKRPVQTQVFPVQS